MSGHSETFTTGIPSLFSDDNPNQTQEISRIGEPNFDKEIAGLDLGKSSHIKQRKVRSDVWKNFEKYKDEDGKDRAKCNICEKVFDGSSTKGTTHLRNHFKSCQKKNEGGGSGDKPAENSVMDQPLNHMDRAKMLIKKSSWFLPLPDSIEGDVIIRVYNEEKEKLRICFEKLHCRFCLIISNVLFGKYTCFMVQFIDDDWKLKEKIISFKCIEGDQIMEVLKNVLSEWGIYNNISSMVIDGHSDKYVMSSNERENWFNSQGSLLFNSKLLCFIDFEYISIICSDFISNIMKVLYDRMNTIFNYITETSSKNETFQSAVDRARSLGKKVTAEVIPTKQEFISIDIVGLLEIALGLKEAFLELENMDHGFKSINLSKEEWFQTTIFYEFYEDLTDDTLLYKYVTANLCFSWLCSIYTKSLVLVKFNSFISEEGSFGFTRGAKKYWDEYNLVLAVAAVLDPRFKMDIVKHWYKKIYGGECETRLAIFTDYFTSVYNEYAKGTNNFQSSTSGSNSYKMLDPSGKPHRSSHDDLDHHRSLNTELHLYLEEVKFPLLQEFDILEWWRVCTQCFPTLARMAHDFLSIRITIPHNYMHFELPYCHKDFDSDIVREAFVCAKNWLKS
ncbi:hypothetical protein LWI29_030570 [Acer saccharum]|uniref:BED-type domain-containing protein n=1 Tax=Acer saccharum TaxID=4024 RepID=A0AA39VBX9_ACESA|nr:hypothetical protein LWI29_030570 [Acer saccharum]